MRALLNWQRVLVTGYSMTPTLLPGDWLLVRHGVPVRGGDLVLGRFRDQPDLLVVKRALRPVDGGWLLGSDNPRAGSDSRQRGVAEVSGVVVRTWPRGPGRPPVPVVTRWLGRPPPAAPDGL